MRALVLQHDHLSPPGAIGERLTDYGYDVEEYLVVPADRFQSPNVDTPIPDLTAYDAVVIMGAAWSVYDDASIGAWVHREIDAVAAADRAGVPVLGICFGGQVLAATHGGLVERSPAPEIGWHAVSSDDDALIPGGEWFQWHFDRWRLPPGSTEVARNASASQGFVLRRNLAVQFHPELATDALIGWLDNGGGTEARAAGYDVEALIEATREREADAAVRARRLVDSFVRTVATTAVS